MEAKKVTDDFDLPTDLAARMAFVVGGTLPLERHDLVGFHYRSGASERRRSGQGTIPLCFAATEILKVVSPLDSRGLCGHVG